MPEPIDDPHQHGDARGGEPALARRAAPLDRREKRGVVLAALAPIGLALLVLIPVGTLTGSTPAEVLSAAIVYGGLVGLAAAFVAIDRFQARQCPRCRERGARGRSVCTACGYDLEERPRYACDEFCAIHLEPGLCPCGRRLHELPTARGIGREIGFILKLGAWGLVFLLGVGIALRFLERGL